MIMVSEDIARGVSQLDSRFAGNTRIGDMLSRDDNTMSQQAHNKKAGVCGDMVDTVATSIDMWTLQKQFQAMWKNETSVFVSSHGSEQVCKAPKRVVSVCTAPERSTTSY